MKTFALILALFVTCSSSEAGTLSKGSAQHKLANKESCSAGTCVTSLRISHKALLEGSLTSGEINELGPNTRIQGTFPLGPTISFRLSDDPAYINGATSVKIVKTTVFNNVTWKHNISMRWDKGVLKLGVKLSAKQQLNNFYGIVWDGVPKTKSKFQSGGGGLISITADNLGDTFVDMSLPVASNVSTKGSASSSSKGQTKLTSSEKTRLTPLPQL